MKAIEMKYIAMICLLSLTGCTADKIFNDPDLSGVLPEIHFLTSVGTRASDTENLTDGAKVRIYPYLQKKGITAPAVTQKDYAVSATVLTPSGTGDAAKAMILPSGTFRFYAVSTNSTAEDVPIFDVTATNGSPVLGNAAGQDGTTTSALKNGVDYLHVTAEKTIQFGTTSTDIPLQFAHKGTQVQLTIIFGGNVGAADANAAETFELAKVYVQQTDPADSYMRLNTGDIRFGNTTAGPPLACNTSNAGGKETLTDNTNMAEMNVVKLGNYVNGTTTPVTQVATYNMLPLKGADGTGTQKLWVQVTVKDIKIGETVHATHTYTGKLDASAGWKPGESNRYTLTLSGSEITFSGVTVESWVAGGSGGEVGDVSDN
ncbi:MAG: fimbrillin family protein [Parabacteroides gordonii]|uniref:fimbrillin family protein n=1 Tax=Parabacteroides gordonii TaxID=574930 RepID=UPI003A87B33B